MLYNANETMGMLGRQRPADLLCGDGIAAKDFNNMVNAYRENGNCFSYETGVDAFMLGYIYGKRAERARRKDK